ncbi:MAG: hypothetical protein NZ750_13150 [Anaerolineae bacterium]|nr:hypothetical protein [Anaerolineae bacterium]MDW8172746.1 hypothetical protein [Anaerolineae bacterium]
MLHLLSDTQQRLAKYWLPALVASGLAWLALIVLGNTPIIRASGLALAIIGVSMALRRLGALLAVSGSLTLAFSPAFWSQTGGGEGEPATIVLAIGAALLALVIVVWLMPNRAQALQIGAGLGLVVFVAIFISQIGTPRSLRLTALVIGWLSFLLIDMLLLANPHPDEAAPPILGDSSKEPQPARPYHTWGLLLLFGVGVINDPLLALLAPSLLLSLLLTYARLPASYWLSLVLLTGLGLRGLLVDYLWSTPYFFALEDWREAERWIIMLEQVVRQFTPFGVVLGVLGLARLARWYPPLGVTTMVAYGAYFAFGLVYVGPNRDVLLLPLFVLQVVWMSYAVFTLSEWARKAQRLSLMWAARLGYAAFPLLLLVQVVQT